MISVPVRLLVGHLIGDYLFQPREMAEEKGQGGDLWWSLLHGIVYTLCVCLTLWNFSPMAMLAIFLTHWPLDRFGIAGWWCRNVLDRHPMDACFWGPKARDVRIGFACLHYAVVDNAMHIILMLAVWQLGFLG